MTVNNTIDQNALIKAIMGGVNMEDLLKRAADMQKHVAETSIEHAGTKIVLPAFPKPMTLEEAQALIAVYA